MADQQASNVIYLSDPDSSQITDQTSTEQPTEETTSDVKEKGFTISYSEVVMRLFETVAEMPEESRGALLEFLQGPLFRQAEIKTATDDIFVVPLEEESAVGPDRHATYIERLEHLKMIRPDTDDDLIVTEE